MATSSIVVPKLKKLVVPAMTAGGYSRRKSNIEYSPAFARDSEGNVIVNVNRDQARKLARAAGYRLSTAAHEKELSEKGYKDGAFDDIFERNGKIYFWNWTDTGLLKPKGEESKYTKKERGRTYWLRIVTEGGKKVGELWVPEGTGGIVREWSVFGLPTETVDITEHKGGTKTHFYFDPWLDEIAILRYRCWSDAHRYSFHLCADLMPSLSGSFIGFRPVRGPVAEYERKVISLVKENEDYRRGYKDGERAGYEKARQEFLQKLDKFKTGLE